MEYEATEIRRREGIRGEYYMIDKLLAGTGIVLSAKVVWRNMRLDSKSRVDRTDLEFSSFMM